MPSRREFLHFLAGVAPLVTAFADLPRALAQQKLSFDDILAFPPKGQVTILHLTDLHAQLVPIYYREPAVNLGVGEAAGRPPHITGRQLLDHFGIVPGSPEAYLLSSDDFDALAKAYGRVGGLDRLATLVEAIRAERGDRVLLLDGGDSWQGSWTALRTRGQDVIEAMRLLRPDAMTAHWEFTLGAERIEEVRKTLGFAFLAANVRDTEWQEPVFEGFARFERGGVAIGVIGQAFPYTPVANPRWLIPQWSFGIREEELAELVRKLREEEKVQLVVLLSHNGFDVDYRLASRVEGIDVILCGHTHDALPKPVVVGRTLLVATGSNGKFLSRLDLEVGADGIRDYAFRLLPVLADVVPPQPQVAARIAELRQPFVAELSEVVAETEIPLYRRGTFNGTFDDVICAALLARREAEIALSPGFRWGTALPSGMPITREFVWNHTAITYPAVYRVAMTGEQIKAILEDVADNLFNPDPYYQQGGDMVRVGNLAYRIDPGARAGSRISDLRLLSTGEPLEAGRSYVVAGWASVNEGVEGPPVWELVFEHLRERRVVVPEPVSRIEVVGR
ncbi:Mannosylglucosyl-3-phosphoglycerate phosphatase [bacterium HR40]|nr:Mannosylglucosyl-3-phosphoglycerate phosphatase [bacterium HR40]